LGKLKSYLLSLSFILNQPQLSISRYRSSYEADLAVSVVSFISWKTLVWSLPHTNKWTSRQEENSLYPYISMLTLSLWKTCPPNITNMLSIKNSSILMFYYYNYYQFQRTFLQNQWLFFLQNKICPFPRQGIYIYVGQSLLWNTVLAKLILLICLVALNGE
jgi:hypothetical protein